MRLFIFTLIINILTSVLCFAQNEAISNIRIRLDTSGQIRILYDLNWIKSNDSIYLEAKGRQSRPLTIRTVGGNIGKGQFAGRNKRAYWSIVKDGYIIDEEIQISILIKSQKTVHPATSSDRTIGGGPSNALLSAFLPGIGNIFVQPKTKKHRIGFRPLLPIVFYGLAGFSAYRGIQAQNRYTIYNQQVRQDIAQEIYNDANSKRHQAIIAAGVGASIWTIDVACTFVKGVKNNKKRQETTESISLGMSNGVPMVGLKINL